MTKQEIEDELSGLFHRLTYEKYQSRQYKAIWEQIGELKAMINKPLDNQS